MKEETQELTKSWMSKDVHGIKYVAFSQWETYSMKPSRMEQLRSGLMEKGH